MHDHPIRLAIIGMGGFAGEHHRAALALEKQGQCRVVCACDPNPDAFLEARKNWEFAARGIPIYTDYLAMLDAHRHELDMVTVPTPVPLHAPMHRAAIERGLGCYLEKPPTLDYVELEEMLAVEVAASKQTMVGFNFIIEAERRALKQRLLQGEFGAVKRVGFLGLASRSTVYFGRAPWAGRLMLDGRLVLDSAMGNAMAHYLHNLLFWAGQTEVLAWEPVRSMRAEMYRAHAIENMDTLFSRGIGTNGVEILVAATHACVGEQFLQESIECELATIRNRTWEPYQIVWNDGREEEIPADPSDLLQANLQYYFDTLRGENPRPLTRLVDTRPFVEYYDLTYVAAKRITHVAGEHVTRSQAEDGKGTVTAIHGIREACDTFLATGRFPSEQGLAWASPGGEASIEEIGQLHHVVAAMHALL